MRLAEVVEEALDHVLRMIQAPKMEGKLMLALSLDLELEPVQVLFLTLNLNESEGRSMQQGAWGLPPLWPRDPSPTEEVDFSM